MERLKYMEEALIACVENEICNLSQTDTKELGEAIDMIKDLEEAIYYATITKAMGETEQEHKEDSHYYGGGPKWERYRYDEPIYRDPYRDMDRDKGRMYYTDSTRERKMPADLRDDKEGRSPVTRKSYMEGKEMHQGKERQMKELEKYMQELTQDMTEMIGDASTDEKSYLEKKLTALATKIGQMK
jgi:hypothetical protein